MTPPIFKIVTVDSYDLLTTTNEIIATLVKI